MIVYVESNFVLEIALQQEDAAAAEGLLERAERNVLEVAFPALAVTEPFSAVTQRGRVRQRVATSLRDQIRELGRSRPHEAVVSTLEPIPGTLASVEKREVDLLEVTVRRLLAVGRSISLDAPVFQQVHERRGRYDLSAQDAIVFSSVVSDLTRQSPGRRKLFVSKNWKDFRDPELVAELRSYRCDYVEDFATALLTIDAWSIAP